MLRPLCIEEKYLSFLKHADLTIEHNLSQARVTLDQLVRAVNEVGAAPGDLMAILEALRQAGALRGELVII